LKFCSERLIRFSHCDRAAVPGDGPRALRRVPDRQHRLRVLPPPQLGDTLRLELSIAKLGRSSIEFVVSGAVGAEEKFRARHKVAMVSLDTFRSLAIPEEMRARMREYVL
jgi:acyl-CoA thioesterase FadM